MMIDRDRYSRLCEVAVHVTPSIRPQGHNILRIPTSGGYEQDEGILIVLNELAIATSHATVALPKLLRYDESRRKEFRDACANLLVNIGAADIKGLEKYHEGILRELRASLSKEQSDGEAESVAERRNARNGGNAESQAVDQ